MKALRGTGGLCWMACMLTMESEKEHDTGGAVPGNAADSRLDNP